jgi:transcriptional regulator GlxA family with amidase domain
MFPALTVDCDPVYIKDGRVWTSAGVTAGMDLALALVEDDQGRAKAHTIARNLVLFLRRPGSQSQFSAAMRADPPADGPIRTVVDAVHANPGGQHGISELAVVGGLSERHLQRRFTAELGVPPAAYVEQVRVEAAATALTEDNKPVDVIARRCGFGTAESMRRAFHRQRGISPSEYRDRFTTTKEFA